MKRLREHLGEAIRQPLTVADMARLCGLKAPDGANTIRRWEVTGPSAQAADLLRVLAMASEHYPILEKFNVFDRHDVPEKERPGRRAQFREQMREDIRRRLG
nr:hypothetical protein [Bradyrhizobium sp. BRP22]